MSDQGNRFNDTIADSVLISEKDDHFTKWQNEEEKTGLLDELEHAATDFKNKAIASLGRHRDSMSNLKQSLKAEVQEKKEIAK